MRASGRSSTPRAEDRTFSLFSPWRFMQEPRGCVREAGVKGIVFNLLEEVVVQHHGEAAWDDLLDAAEASGSYTSLGSYRDQEMLSLVVAAAAKLALSPADVLRWFGRQAMPLLAQRYPTFFAQHSSARPFVLSVNGIIHPEVRKLYAGAHCPHFDFDEQADGSVVVGYRSPRQLCHLAHGFIEGAADHYGETAEVTHLACTANGDSACTLRLAFA